ncbi:MAG: 4Fe-4S dicluster domain-containing protein [Proteobacteria bacterium]|nr:4Fe-4S dicluster domain-containing protein [Pseudomonadota bacterium]
MSPLNISLVENYRNSFLSEVEANVEGGNWVKMCMQCGVCSGSCPLGSAWEHPPQELFMMIRAGKREAVLTSASMWMCTSCYSCIVRCPRELPITHIMHGLATYAKRLGLEPKNQPTARFAEIFWNNMKHKGRVNELKLGLSLYFMNGFAKGIKETLKKQKLGMRMFKTKRVAPRELMGGGHGIKDPGGLQKILAKAEEIETSKISNQIKQD